MTAHGLPVSRWRMPCADRPATRTPWGGARAWSAVAAVAAAALWPWAPSQAWDVQRMNAAAAALGPRGQATTRELQQVLVQIASWDDGARLEAVNNHFNRAVAYADDDLVWDQTDYWASPLELLAGGEGDCEDFAIAKYFALVAAGVPVARLRLVYARAQLPAGGGRPARAQAHMVLAYYGREADEPQILDNLVADIRPASRRPDLTPVFSFNTDGLWQGPGKAADGDPLARLSRWREVVRKARAEGFL
jgi:predicted transglutaminase-like cysteine proteinase